MDKTLIRNWNRRVKKDDQVIFLGDFCFGDPSLYLKKLKGNKVFIRGNHDNSQSLDARIPYLVVSLNDKVDAFCTHRPEDYSSSYHVNIIGHIHQHWHYKSIYNSILINVGVDMNDYKPISSDEILGILKKAEGEKERFMKNLTKKSKKQNLKTTL